MSGFTVSNVIEVLVFLTALLSGYIKLQTKIKELEMRIISMEHDFASQEKHDEKVMQKLDDISNQIMQVRIQMENKQDRS